MRITIIIHEHGPDGNSVRQLFSPGRSPPEAPTPIPESSAASHADLEAPGEDPADEHTPTRADAEALLLEMGVENHVRLLKSYLPSRIIEVCEAAKRKSSRLKNPAGYILRALAKGWAV